MRIVKSGNYPNPEMVTEISLGETIDPSKYYVRITTGSQYAVLWGTGSMYESWGDGCYISAKTSTSFTVTFNSAYNHTAPFSYEVIEL